MGATVTHVVRGVRSELAKTSGRSVLWTIWIPAAVLLPLIVTLGIAYFAEAFAQIPGQINIESSTTSNSVYWVISITVVVLMLSAAYSYASEFKNGTIDHLWHAFPRRWTVPLSKWLVHGVVSAIVSALLVVIVLSVLPRAFPLVYGAVELTSGEGARFLWCVPLYAFLACGFGIGLAAIVRSSAGAIAVILLWVFIIENSVSFLPNGYEILRFMPFYNAIYSTGQQLAFNPPWGVNGAALYCTAIFGSVFVVGAFSSRVRTNQKYSEPSRKEILVNMAKESDPTLPLAERDAAHLPGHWLLARLGKRVLRPGGRKLTERVLSDADLRGSDVLELAPGLGKTAQAILEFQPASYTGVESDDSAAELTKRAIGDKGVVVRGEAAQTGLGDASVDVVVGEAMLTMQSDRHKEAIVAEAFRVLREGGRYAIHELAIEPDDVDAAVKTEIRTALARSIKVNARPLTREEWENLFRDAGFEIETVSFAPMALLQPRRILADEGLVGTLRFVRNVLRDSDARARVLTMRATFTKYRRNLVAIEVIAKKPL